MKQKNGKELPRALSMAFLCDPKAFTRFLAMDERAQSAVVIRAQDMGSGKALQAFVHRIGQKKIAVFSKKAAILKKR